MKKLKENYRLGIYQGIATLLGIITLICCFVPAYFENGRADLSLFNIMLGDGRIGSSPALIFGFLCLVLGIITEIVLLILLLINKSDSLMTTILAIGAGVLILIGTVLMTCAVFISGINKLTTELGFTQGVWGFLAGNFLVPIFGLVSIIMLYPQALIMLHHLDQKDAEKLQATKTKD